LPAHGSGGARATIKMIAPQKFFPRNKDGSAGGGWGEECRAVRAQKPRRTAQKLLGRNRAEISLSFFEFFSGGARKRKIVRENFCEVAAGALAEAGGGTKAYDYATSHHALRAWHIVSGRIRSLETVTVASPGKYHYYRLASLKIFTTSVSISFRNTNGFKVSLTAVSSAFTASLIRSSAMARW